MAFGRLDRRDGKVLVGKLLRPCFEGAAFSSVGTCSKTINDGVRRITLVQNCYSWGAQNSVLDV